jgi:hypothetical protein
VGLHIDVFGAKELFGAVAGEGFDFVGVLAATVVALAGITFRVLVREDAAGGLQNRL